MGYPTQEEYNVVLQQGGILHVKVDLLNFKFQKVDEISGNVLPNSTFSCDANSAIRRTCSLSIVPTDSSFDIANGSKIWLDKYIQVYVGIEDVQTKLPAYTNMGIYIIDEPSQVYDAVTNTITIKGLDLMAKMTGLRNGNLEGLKHVIPQNSNVRDVFIETIALAGFDRYVIEECKFDVPNDINISVGGTVYDILNKLVDIDVSYQIYFDTDGVFHYGKIPNGYNEQVIVDDQIWEATLINYKKNTDFSSLKNYIEVYGKTHDIKNYPSAISVSGNTYNLTIANVSNIRNNLKIGFTTPSSTISGNINIKINSLASYPLKYEDGSTPMLEPNTYYVAKFISDKSYYLFMGEVTPYGVAMEENPDSPFYIDGNLGIIRIVLDGGEYDNIYMSDLARQRAEWELYTRCRLLDNVSLTCVPIYWLDVNWLVEITLPNKNSTPITEQYLIKSINTNVGVDGLQTITLMKYYPLYPSII